MAERITKRSEDFSKWYTDVIIQAKLADYSPVKGCMVIRPNGYGIWEKMQQALDRMFKDTGHKNAYFPLFIPESFIKKESEHVEGFSPQLAVVTHAGGGKLEENLVVRPTSETIINAMFAKWIQSYRDLPLLINQWANVVRWEMRTRLFLRTTEFLWQEGHTCHATAEEAEEETLRMLEVYRKFAEEYMAMPVICGVKTESEKFAGAVRTYCIEAMMQDKKALQAGTSHNLGQNFAKAFDTKFLDKDGEWKHVHQTSWGVSTRLVGGLIMTHGDDSGLIIPPKLAPVHCVLIPILKKGADNEAMVARLKETADLLSPEITAVVDDEAEHSPGYKYHEWDLRGVPARIEFGPRDMQAGQMVLVRRDTGEKRAVPVEKIKQELTALLNDIQNNLFERAKKFMEDNTHTVNSYDEFKEMLASQGGFYKVHLDTSPETEKKLQEETKATVRCIPLETEKEPGKCMITGKKCERRVIVARAY